MHSDIFYFIFKIICWSQSTKLILQLANGENWQLEKQRYDAIFPVTGKTTEVLEGLLRSPVVESQSLAHKPGLRSWSLGGCYLQHTPLLWASGCLQLLARSSLTPALTSLFFLSSLCCFPSSFLCIQTFSILCSMGGTISWCSGGGEIGIPWGALSKGLARVPGQN